jgi:hypothetical protein
VFSDTGILRVDNPTFWFFGSPWITVNPNAGGHPADPRYDITAVVNPEMGWRVCVTAAHYPGTTCGTVESTADAPGGTFDLFRMSGPDPVYPYDPFGLCIAPGDSGAPVFAYHNAYGILIAGSDDEPSCGQTGWAEQALEAADYMNVYILEN